MSIQTSDAESLPIQENRSARYISEMTAQLATIARRDGFDVLARLLEMAALEAEATAGEAKKRGRLAS